MGSTWSDAKLGQFEWEDDYQWVKRMRIPAFDVFTYGMDDREKPLEYEVAFEGGGNSGKQVESPSAEAVKVMAEVLEGQERFGAMIVNALWEDFNGRGPRSGMWWHGDLATVAMEEDAEFLETIGMQPLDSVKALYSWLGLRSIVLRSDRREGWGPLVEFRFSAFFEDEHGVGVLTDGKKIVGAGYSHDCSPYRG